MGIMGYAGSLSVCAQSRRPARGVECDVTSCPILKFSSELFLEFDGNHLKSLTSQVLRQVFNGVELPSVSILRSAFFRCPVRIREPELDVVQEHPDLGGWPCMTDFS